MGFMTMMRPDTRRVYATGTTNGSGVFSVSVSPPFTTLTHVNVQGMPPTDNTIFLRVTSADVNGVSVVAEQRTGLSVLSLTVLSLATTPAVGQNVTIEMIGT